MRQVTVLQSGYKRYIYHQETRNRPGERGRGAEWLVGLNPYVVLGSAVVGLLVGLTGAGGGALMTPMLILLFNVKPAAAISSDLVAAVVMRPVGSVVHMRRGTVNYRLVGWMCAGSVPMAFLGAYLLQLLGGGSGPQGTGPPQGGAVP